MLLFMNCLLSSIEMPRSWVIYDIYHHFIHLKGKGCFSKHRENLKREENQLFSSSHHTASASYFPFSLSLPFSTFCGLSLLMLDFTRLSFIFQQI